MGLPAVHLPRLISVALVLATLNTAAHCSALYAALR